MQHFFESLLVFSFTVTIVIFYITQLRYDEVGG